MECVKAPFAVVASSVVIASNKEMLIVIVYLKLITEGTYEIFYLLLALLGIHSGV